MKAVEHITAGGKPIAYIIRAEIKPLETTFVTPVEFNQQVGFVVYPAGGEIQRHAHLPLKRDLAGASEVLIVRQGRCEVDIYNDERQLIATRELRIGDLLLTVSGAHGFRILEPTVFLEIKQGPYTGVHERERF